MRKRDRNIIGDKSGLNDIKNQMGREKNNRNIWGWGYMLGEKLKNLRLNAGLTQEELADELLVSKDAVSKYERNYHEPSDGVKIRISEYFNVSADYLLGTIDTPEPLHRVELMLPKAFPDEAREELSWFVNYLVFKYDTDKETQRLLVNWRTYSPEKRKALLALISEK